MRWTYSFGNLVKEIMLLAQNMLGTFVGEGTGQALPWWGSALLCTPHLPSPAPQPCRGLLSLAQQRQCSTPASGALSLILSGQMTTRPTWGQGPGKTRGTLAKAWTERAFIPLPHGVFVSKTPLEPESVAILVLCCIFSLFLLLIPFSQSFG